WVHDEPDSDIAVALLKEWTSKGTVMLAPALLAYEITNVLYQNTRKGAIARDRAIETLEEIMQLGLEFDFPLDSALSVRATELEQKLAPDATNKIKRQARPITRKAVERLRRTQQQIMTDRKGKPFSENSTDMLEKAREERTRELMGEE